MTGDWVFGYGSLAAAAPGVTPDRTIRPEGFVADLRGFRRGWGVAMDNRLDLPGYKYYLDPDGRRPEIYVAFLDVRRVADGEALTTGLCLPVSPSDLPALDARERNYHRVEVSSELGVSAGRVWLYTGTPEGRRRLARGRREASAVIHAGYLRAVHTGLAALGAEVHEACRASLEPGDLPVRELVRRELP